MPNQKAKVAVLISGNGSNLQALIDATQEEGYPASIDLVISNKKEAYGLERAQKHNIACETISHTDYPDRQSFDTALHAALVKHEIDIVCLAGFMRLLTAEFVGKWEGKMINIHPSLLPSFKGANAAQEALDYGVKVSGCSVHFVTADMDAGPIILQASVPVYDKDDEASLLTRIHEAEHYSFPLALKLLASGKLTIEGNHVHIKS